MSNAKYARLAELLADIDSADSPLRVSEYHESGIYTVTVVNGRGYRSSLIGSLDEAIAFARGVKAALEVL